VKGIDVSLCAIVDPEIDDLFGLGRFICEVVEGGVTWLQVRCKDTGVGDTVEFARRVMAIAGPRGIPVIINDRVDVALALGASGVHLGVDDLPVELARRLAGSRLVIGATVRGLDSARMAAEAGADYVGAGPVFGTTLKPDLARMDPETFSEIRSGISLPMIAIGGINEENVGLPISLGADGVAVISALRQCQNPRDAASRLKEAILEARTR
jgi:thiamine-phosphate pyrophosphorylase